MSFGIITIALGLLVDIVLKIEMLIEVDFVLKEY